MEQVKQVSEKAYIWMDTMLPPNNWSRSHFSTQPRCEILISNHCEVFNNFIVDARDKLIISMMETIRELIMRRIQVNRD